MEKHLTYRMQQAILANDMLAVEAMLDEGVRSGAWSDPPQPEPASLIAKPPSTLAHLTVLALEQPDQAIALKMCEYCTTENAGDLATVLFSAALPNEEAVRLLTCRVALPQKDRESSQLVDECVKKGTIATLQALLDAGAAKMYQPKGSDGSSATDSAAYAWRADMIDALVAAGFDVNYTTRDGLCGLHYATLMPINAGEEAELDAFRQTVECYLRHGVSIDSMDNDGGTPLGHCATGGVLAQFEALLDLGADPYKGGPRRGGLTAAADFWRGEILRVALARGIDLTRVDDEGRSLLHIAASSESRAMGALPPTHVTALGNTVDLLCSAGVDIDARDHAGNTPFLSSLAIGGPERVQLLLGRGADVYARNNAGQDAHAIIQELEDAGEMHPAKACDLRAVLYSWEAKDSMSAMMAQLALPGAAP